MAAAAEETYYKHYFYMLELNQNVMVRHGH